MNNKTCFISYCREDIDIPSLELFIKELRAGLSNDINVVYDNELSLGTNLQKFMKDSIFKAGSIIVLLSPEYKKRAEERRESGVNTEFTYILSKIDQIGLNNNSDICIIPIVFAGNFADSCPEAFKNCLGADFTKFKAFYNQLKDEYYIPSETMKKYRKDIERIISVINSQMSYYSDSVKEEERLFKERTLVKEDEPNALNPFDAYNAENELLKNTKHDYLKDYNNIPFEEILYETYSYKKLALQTAFIFIGRKGSGKSTLPHLHYNKNKQNYKGLLDINVNYFKLQQSFDLFYDSHLKKDIKRLFSATHKYFQYIWEIFMFTCCISVIIEEYKQSNLNSIQREAAKYLIAFIKNEFGEEEVDKKYIFEWAFAEVYTYIEKQINTARAQKLSSFIYDLNKNIDRKVILENIFGKEVLNALKIIIRNCKRKILISFDGFDMEFESFRNMTINYITDAELRRDRTIFEMDFLKGFIHYIMNCKTQANYSVISPIIDVCVTVPQDRFIEMLETERDSYRYIETYHYIQWSALELSSMLTKRLDYLCNTFNYLMCADLKNIEYGTIEQEKEINRALIRFCSDIPLETEVELGNNRYKIHIFIEVLRHTFWRPREILIYFYKIISVLRDHKKKRMDITKYTINTVISKRTKDIVQKEFISEFKNHCTNLIDILNAFKRKKQILCYGELEEILSGVHFDFINKETVEKDFKEKLKFLYEIGFLGFEISDKLMNANSTGIKDIFYFNEVEGIYEELFSNDFEEFNYLIHPIFCETLNLDTSNQKLVLNMDWNYLQYQDMYGVCIS